MDNFCPYFFAISNSFLQYKTIFFQDGTHVLEQKSLMVEEAVEDIINLAMGQIDR